MTGPARHGGDCGATRIAAVAPTGKAVAGVASLVAAALGLALAGATVPPRPAAAQQAPKPPEQVAGEFQRAFESMAWAAAAQRIHPDALDHFHEVVTMLVDTDARGEVPDRLLGGLPPGGYGELAPEEVFRRVMTALMEETPGLMHALVTRRHEIVGGVPEGEATVHVVYRLLPMLQGAEPEVKVMTLTRSDAPGRPWRVLRSDELDVVRSALRGIPVGFPVPPPPPPDTGRSGGR